MADNVAHLPRPRAVRPVPEPLGPYVHMSRNDHKALLNVLSAGDLRCFGVVIHAAHVDRHRELREQIIEHRLASCNRWVEAMANKTREQRKRLDALRVAFSHQWEAAPPQSFASVPLRRAVRDGR